MQFNGCFHVFLSNIMAVKMSDFEQFPPVTNFLTSTSDPSHIFETASIFIIYHLEHSALKNHLALTLTFCNILMICYLEIFCSQLSLFPSIGKKVHAPNANFPISGCHNDWQRVNGMRWKASRCNFVTWYHNHHHHTPLRRVNNWPNRASKVGAIWVSEY